MKQNIYTLFFRSKSKNNFSNSAQKATRLNELGIQMLPHHLHCKLFKNFTNKEVSPKLLATIKSHLKQHGLTSQTNQTLTNVDFELPELFGNDLEEHFFNLGYQQSQPYSVLTDYLLEQQLPIRPATWFFKEGWTKYDSGSKKAFAVKHICDDAIIFDVETMVAHGNYPVIATAVSSTAWYSWCSPRLFENKVSNKAINYIDLIPINNIKTKKGDAKLIIGHNVSFDRSFIKDQYNIQTNKTRFLDTMSLHIAVSGLTSFQRMLFLARKAGSKRKEILEHNQELDRRGIYPSMEWTNKTSLNNLNDVYQFYSGNDPLPKHLREVFMHGNKEDVIREFQTLMTYCAKDVQATYEVLRSVWPEFKKRFPHPVTLAGMLEMGIAFLPVNQNWLKYIDESNNAYLKFQDEIVILLQKLASDALVKNEDIKNDVWLWDLDRSNKKLRIKDTTTEPHKISTYKLPSWFAELCPRGILPPQPSLISLQRRVSPKLLRLSWDGYPLHYSKKHGWGYLVPLEASGGGDVEKELIDQELLFGVDNNKYGTFPMESLSKICAQRKTIDDSLKQTDVNNYDFEMMTNLDYNDDEEMGNLWQEANYGMPTTKQKKPVRIKTTLGPYYDVLPGCIFYKLPHRDGVEKNVGNPLSKEFLKKIGLPGSLIRSNLGQSVEETLQYAKMCSYWKNSYKRIKSQIVIKNPSEDMDTSVILPRLVVAGTVTRRAVEPTWLTASNAYADRIGSELKAMVQTPPGYHFVGADVDSQELWIAAILGDSNFAGIHGCTGLGWMTLQGSKQDGTDLHSKIAKIVNITREQAKVFNYGRIYGAGQKFAVEMLMKFNDKMSETEAKEKAKKMFQATKGKRTRVRRKIMNNDVGNNSNDEDEKIAVSKWQGGSESDMFNKLESIARSKTPVTPVLGCRISKTLEPQNVNNEFMTSRINWVVQSSAVDYLHLMLVNMKWLFDIYKIDARFSISIHDEVRYLVKSEDKYRAALALQITNLFTRSMFAQKLGMMDLPMSVAFFSSVEVDTCLRKEADMECVTPSNPKGLSKQYNIHPGESLDMHSIIEKTSGTLNKDT